jgi:NADH-quinone oxidoreductase subunit J
MITLKEAAVFGFFVAVMLGTALFATRSRDAMHGVIYLSIALVAIAVLFLLLGSTVLFIFQLIIYVGAVTVLYVWGIMLMRHEIMDTAK